ncbi:MAG: ATP-binding protein [Pseudomonadota bacterium]
MQFRTKIVTFALALALGAICCATLTLILARGIDRGLQSVTLAEDQLALYLTLETNVSDLLRLHITAAAAPMDETLIRIGETKSDVREDIATIRRILHKGQNPENGDGLARLNRIELVLDEIEAAFARIDLDGAAPQPVNAFAAPMMAVVEALDERLAPLVDLAIANEAAEVVQARNAIAELTRRSVRLGTAAGALTLLAAVLGVITLLSAFMRPFDALLEGAARLAQGNLGFRIPEGKRDEFGRLSRDFNVMAAQLERSDRALRAEEEDLQRRVAARTAELEEANARLADQDDTRRRFLADVSHELRTPLTVMRGEAEVALRARDQVLSAGARDALDSVVEQSEHMGRLVDDLLFVARREAGEAPLSLTRIELGGQVRRTLADAGQLASNAVIVLQADEAAMAAQIEADPGRLHQLMMVLLDNALRYSPDNSEICVDVRRTERNVEVTVRDKGIGIPADELPYIFERFVRGSNALPGGTGLGLPVAKAIAEAHGGALSIDSEEGVGTSVTLTLSVVDERGDP